MLQGCKKGKGGRVVWDDDATELDIDTTGTHIPMEPRSIDTESDTWCRI